MGGGGRERERVLDLHLRDSWHRETPWVRVGDGLGRFLHERGKHLCHCLLLERQPVVACCYN